VSAQAKLWILLLLGVVAMLVLIALATFGSLSRGDLILGLISGVGFCSAMVWGLYLGRANLK
jgi:hypothetical protein